MIAYTRVRPTNAAAGGRGRGGRPDVGQREGSLRMLPRNRNALFAVPGAVDLAACTYPPT